MKHDRRGDDRFRDRGDPDDRLRLDLSRTRDFDLRATRNECGEARHLECVEQALER
jgi:hypothetical protein